MIAYDNAAITELPLIELLNLVRRKHRALVHESDMLCLTLKKLIPYYKAIKDRIDAEKEIVDTELAIQETLLKLITNAKQLSVYFMKLRFRSTEQKLRKLIIHYYAVWVESWEAMGVIKNINVLDIFERIHKGCTL